MRPNRFASPHKCSTNMHLPPHRRRQYFETLMLGASVPETATATRTVRQFHSASPSWNLRQEQSLDTTPPAPIYSPPLLLPPPQERRNEFELMSLLPLRNLASRYSRKQFSIVMQGLVLHKATPSLHSHKGQTTHKLLKNRVKTQQTPTTLS